MGRAQLQGHCYTQLLVWLVLPGGVVGSKRLGPAWAPHAVNDHDPLAGLLIH